MAFIRFLFAKHNPNPKFCVWNTPPHLKKGPGNQSLTNSASRVGSAYVVISKTCSQTCSTNTCFLFGIRGPESLHVRRSPCFSFCGEPYVRRRPKDPERSKTEINRGNQKGNRRTNRTNQDQNRNQKQGSKIRSGWGGEKPLSYSLWQGPIFSP